MTKRSSTLIGALLASLLLCLVGVTLAREFRQALPGYNFSFPRDHAAHKDYKTEWWYYTGHLQANDGRQFGYELTFFRAEADTPNPPKNTRWKLTTLYPAHFAVSDENRREFFFTDRLNRDTEPSLGVAGAREDVYSVWNQDWFAEQLGDRMFLRAESPKYNLRLMLTPNKPPVVHGSRGVSQKADCVGCASHYYSLTRMRTDGVLYVDGKPVPVTGVSWMDHEFGSNQLTEKQTGWDWFSLQLNNNTELMLYVLRRKDGTLDPNSSGTWVATDGSARHLRLADFNVKPLSRWTSPASKATYPMGWEVSVPSERLSVRVQPAFENQELRTGRSTGVTYWEGSSKVSGTLNGQPVQGKAYVEMTGYDKAFRQKI